jgi:hypothetical protein
MPDPSEHVAPVDVRSRTQTQCLSAPALWQAVLNARTVLRDERHESSRGMELAARLVLLQALEAYVVSLKERGHPIPYALRDELRLQRLTCRASRLVGPS